jgi:hypothetical protein
MGLHLVLDRRAIYSADLSLTPENCLLGRMYQRKSGNTAHVQSIVKKLKPGVKSRRYGVCELAVVSFKITNWDSRDAATSHSHNRRHLNGEPARRATGCHCDLLGAIGYKSTNVKVFPASGHFLRNCAVLAACSVHRMLLPTNLYRDVIFSDRDC